MGLLSGDGGCRGLELGPVSASESEGEDERTAETEEREVEDEEERTGETELTEGTEGREVECELLETGVLDREDSVKSAFSSSEAEFAFGSTGTVLADGGRRSRCNSHPSMRQSIA